MIAFPDGTTRKFQNPWRWKLEDAERRYRDARNQESHAEYLRTLKIFSDLVLRYELPHPLYPAAGN
jgi:hypothetical protein